MSYAIIKSGGKQYKVAPGAVIEIEKLPSVKPNDTYAFDQVLLYVSDEDIKLGNPTVVGVSVLGKVIEHSKTKKIRVSQFKAKSRYRRVFGHRQNVTRIQIESVGGNKPLTKNPVKKQVALKSAQKKVTKTLSLRKTSPKK